MRPYRAAVVGLGRAGRARVREIESSDGFALAATVSRRPSIGTATWDGVLRDPTIDAVFVCTENASHGELVKQALDANKHVCVEFPLCLDPTEARSLFQLADRRQLHLHVGHIELLTGEHQARRELASHDLQKATLSFCGDFAGWIADRERAGPPAFQGVARLTILADLFSSLMPRRVTLDTTESGYRLDATFRTTRDVEVQWTEERRVGAPRSTAFSAIAKDGTTMTPETPNGEPTTSLFGLDLARLQERLDTGDRAIVERMRILQVITLASWIGERSQVDE